jgi:hypothetical protein
MPLARSITVRTSLSAEWMWLSAPFSAWVMAPEDRRLRTAPRAVAGCLGA